MKKLTIQLLALAFVSRFVLAGEFKYGQTILVVPDRANLYSGSRVVTTARKGDSLSVLEVRGRWIGVAYRGKKGWIKSEMVRTYRRPVSTSTSRVTAPARPRTTAKATPRKRTRTTPRRLTLNGYFTEGGSPRQHDLRAVLEREGTDRWKIAFHFIWGNSPQTYTGHMNGNLQSGEVEGRAGSGRRSWAITGSAENGTLRCKHYEVTGGGSRRYTGEFVIGK
jgi:hypothetical protein